eukprot:TRINITY_DN40170_c0_g1_i2.p3 TRINITY_DN40170_c0_g1~~TRINITY_DN40170_c0_g1_i2.p3  ORF type:complete len:227 (-),score=30.78 TRINITY_DN40170_c0_g1_i2:477-1118(-)
MSQINYLQLPCKSKLCSYRPKRARLQICAAIKKAASQNVVCTKQFIIKEGQQEQMKQLCQTAMQYSKEKIKVKENGIFEFEIFQDMWEQQVFHSWERYLNNRCMNDHSSSKELMQFMEKVDELLEKPIGVVLYEWNDGNIGNSCVQIGPRGEGGLDDASGASGATAGAAMRQTSSATLIGDLKRGEEGDSFGMNLEFPWFKKMKDQLFGAKKE